MWATHTGRLVSTIVVVYALCQFLQAQPFLQIYDARRGFKNAAVIPAGMIRQDDLVYVLFRLTRSPDSEREWIATADVDSVFLLSARTTRQPPVSPVNLLNLSAL